MEHWDGALRVVCFKTYLEGKNHLQKVPKSSTRIFGLEELHLQVQSAGQVVIVVIIVDVTVVFP